MGDCDPADDMRAIGAEISLLHYRFNAALDRLHSGGEPVAPLRAVMMNLAHAPMTVPQIAALRPVSRQYIQRVVDRLLTLGWIERRANPAHRRSPLYALTAAGRARLDLFARGEAEALVAAAEALGTAEERALLLGRLRTLRDHIDAAMTETPV